MVIKKKVHPWYQDQRLLGYNGTFNFVVGGRGLGKTYNFKRRAIRNFIKRGEQFIYLRRYKSELHARNTFFADIASEFPDYDFRINGNTAQVAPASTEEDKKRPWQTMGYFVALSTSQTQKSVSFPLVTSIIFDEFIIERGALHYLQDEATIFTNFYSTVDRYNDRCKVFFLANSVSIDNPYFAQYQIRPDEDKEFIVPQLPNGATGYIVCHFPDSEAFAASIYETAFGRFIKGTDYAEYAVSNTFDDNHNEMLGIKGSNARYIFTLELSKARVSVWHDVIQGEYFVMRKLPRNQQIFTLNSQSMTEDKILLTKQDRPIASLRTAFRSAKVRFDEPSTRNAFQEIFKR